MVTIRIPLQSVFPINSGDRSRGLVSGTERLQQNIASGFIHVGLPFLPSSLLDLTHTPAARLGSSAPSPLQGRDTNEPFFRKITRDRGIEDLNENLRAIRFRYPKLPIEIDNSVVDFLKTRPNPTVLELGTGEGILLKELAKIVELREKGFQATGLDLYPPTRKIREVTFLSTNIHQILPVKDRYADLTVANYVLQYVEDALPVINEMIRCTKPGGYILIGGKGKYLLKSDDPTSPPVPFFQNLSIDSKHLRFFSTFYSGEDLVLIQVIDPQCRITGYVLVPEDSMTMTNIKEEVTSGAHFVYKKVA